MKLKEICNDLPYVYDMKGDMDTEILSLVSTSSEVSDRGLFFCVVGLRSDAHNYAQEAIRNGCVALVVQRFLPLDVPQVLVKNVRAAMARMCAAFYGFPSRSMKMCGITGTKGKTTTSYMFKSICEAAGFKCGLIGTTGTLIGSRKMASHLTTPDPVELQRTLRMMADEKVEIVGMEVSAHAIDMCRLDGMAFDVGCFTNFSQDHLDYFGTMERYFDTKKSFMTGGQVRNAALNADDETIGRIREELSVPYLTYGISAEADLYARDIEISENGVEFKAILHGTNEFDVHLNMTGMFNVYNALAAASCAMVLGIETQNICKGLAAIQSVPGRIETLQTRTPYKIILDYSHSPDALTNILRTVREFARGRIIALFGCGGDRDHAKRPAMGHIGGELADFCVLTSDNPRSEDPMQILASIEEGIRTTGTPYVVIENRREAIRYAMEMAKEGDIIVLAGKGHETYQEIMGVKRPFDEKIVVQELLAEMQGHSGTDAAQAAD